MQNSFGGGPYDAVVTRLNAAGSGLLYSTYLGGSGDEFGNAIAVDASGNAYVAGETNSSDFPTTPGGFQTTFGGTMDAFVTKISIADIPVLVLTPSSLTFAPEAVGTTSAVQKIRLSDNRTKPLKGIT